MRSGILRRIIYIEGNILYNIVIVIRRFGLSKIKNFNHIIRNILFKRKKENMAPFKNT
jgi:hypothetical protein